MKSVSRVMILCLCLTALMVAIGCGISPKKLDQAQQRINVLKSKGVPDSGLSEAIVLLYDAKDANQKEDWSRAGKSGKKAMVAIARAEAVYNEKIESLKPETDQLRLEITAASQQLSGLQKKKLDSLAAKIDSFAAMNWMLQAYDRSKTLVNALPRFKIDQDRATELKPRIPGTWTCVDETKSKADPDVNAKETKIFNFKNDGTVNFKHFKKGQSSPLLKEDWEFEQTGTWDVTGDTVELFIQRFNSKRQNFERCHVSEDLKKKEWKKEPPGPVYDSTITDHSQDLFVTFTDLEQDFKKQP